MSHLSLCFRHFGFSILRYFLLFQIKVCYSLVFSFCAPKITNPDIRVMSPESYVSNESTTTPTHEVAEQPFIFEILPVYRGLIERNQLCSGCMTDENFSKYHSFHAQSTYICYTVSFIGKSESLKAKSTFCRFKNHFKRMQLRFSLF